MAETILAFHSQLSVVMETVLKAAMFEITRLVEVSFLEEVMRGRQEVEALKQRLQRAERRLVSREGGRRGRCGGGGRATAPREECPQPGAEDVKEEGNTEGDPGCVWEVPDSPPAGISQEVATPARTPHMGPAEIITIDLEEDRTDSMHSADDLKELTCTGEDGLQGQPCQLQQVAVPRGVQGDRPKPRPQASAGAFGFERAAPQDHALSPAQGGAECSGSAGEGEWGVTVKVEGVPSEEGGALKQEEEEPSRMERGEERGEIPPLSRAATPEELARPALCHADERDPGGGSLEPLPGERSFSCLHCGKSFSQMRNLRDHQRYHTGNKTHRCTHCGKGFVYMCHLKVHLQSHTGERPYSCAQCGKTFTYLCNLKSHQQYHMGEKPYSCAQCGKGFRQLSHLKKHRFMHTGERPYRCADCGKRFAANGDLKRHQRIHTR